SRRPISPSSKRACTAARCRAAGRISCPSGQSSMSAAARAFSPIGWAAPALATARHSRHGCGPTGLETLMAPPLLTLFDIGLTSGSTQLLDGAALSLAAGEKLALVGRNGSGKSTLLKIAAGIIEPDRGERFVQPGATVRYLPQEPDLSGFETTLAYVEAGLGAVDDAYRAQYLLETLGLTGRESPDRLSGGEARRAALARVLAPEPDILLL